MTAADADSLHDLRIAGDLVAQVVCVQQVEHALLAAAGTGGTFITFDPKVHVQRAGLALTNGVVLVSWASHEDITPSHGWIMGFDATTLARVGTFVATPDSYNGGIWQGGRAPTIDSDGNAYFATGNGKFDGVRSFGDTLLKLRVSRSGLTLLDYFTPGNESALSDGEAVSQFERAAWTGDSTSSSSPTISSMLHT
jgi:hypothetical protein